MTPTFDSRLTVRYGRPEEAPADALAVIRFETQQEARRAGSPVVPLQPLGDASAEIWTTGREVEFGRSGRISWRSAGDLLFAFVEPAPEPDSLEEAAESAYSEMLDFVRASGKPHFLRIWNHVPAINEERGGLERYRRFSIGRHRAFAARGYALAGDLPAASAVGSHGGELTIYFLASRNPGTQIENPRQISAFAYPPEYGPKSPSFSRGCVRRTSDGAEILLSGTASIVGHKSVHEGDLMAQLEETMVNIDTLLRHAGSQHGLGNVTLTDLTSLKVYVRRAADRSAIEAALSRQVTAECSVLYVEADICRRELLLEIEGIAEKRL